MEPQGYTVAILNKEPYLNTLPMAVRLPFFKALIAEDQAGHTTDEAMEFLNKAIEAEDKAAETAKLHK